MAKILLVEDEPELAERLTDWFSMENHVLEIVDNGEDALQLLKNFTYDVIVLDWGLPGITGIEVCRTYRQEGGKAPVLFLTGKGDVASKETGLDIGADDYLVKPFDVRELSARIRSLLRRPASLVSNALSAGGINLDVQARSLTSGDKTVQLMPKQCALLEYLMRNPNRFYSAKALLDAVWPSDSEASESTIRTWVKTLREKLSKLGKEDCIKTVLGSGYMFESKDSGK